MRPGFRPIAAMSALVLGFARPAAGGPYSAALDDPGNPHDAPVPGFVGPHGDGKARIPESGGTFMHPDNRVNPVFCGWADDVADYSPAPGVAGMWTDSALALGPVTGDNFDIVSLGDVGAAQIANGDAPGSITLTFAEPVRDKTGADLVVFENGLVSQGGAGVAGQILAELAHVEVSSDGVNFARFPSRSLTPGPVGAYGTVDASNVLGLAGKHANALGESWGTPFDLAVLADHPAVAGGAVELGAITHVRIVDVPGDGSFKDATGAAIHDAWLTVGSGGHDLEAVGVIGRDLDFEAWQDRHALAGGDLGEMADPDADGLPNLLEYAAGLPPDSPAGRSQAQRPASAGGAPALAVRRDERAVDLVLEIESSADLRHWEVIARSSGGNAFHAVAPHAPQITETQAPGPASVGVMRVATIIDTAPSAPRRFLRLCAHRLP